MHNLKHCLEIIKANIKCYPDFPRTGVMFRDIFSLFQNPTALKALNEVLTSHLSSLEPKPEVVIGLEARGFLLGPMLALQLELPFVPIRKKGKLPGETKQQSYELEYGTDTFEIQAEALKEGQKVVIVDDLLATGGSLQAAERLVAQLGAQVLQSVVVVELPGLQGRRSLTAPVHALLQL